MKPFISRHSIHIYATVIIACLTVCSCCRTRAPTITVTGSVWGKGKPITLNALKTTLPTNKITVGFDIDDTVLFSTPGFIYASTNTDGANGTNKYGKDFEHNPQFWKDMNQIHDKYSVPKEVAKALLSMHNNRGDSIFFITKRSCYNDDAQVMQNRMNTVFQLTASTLICTHEGSKTPIIEENKIDIYYGDSDSDMQYSLAVQAKKVRPVRVLRSTLAENKPIPKNGYNPGAFGEEIILNSEN